jgi:hypothetical protein
MCFFVFLIEKKTLKKPIPSHQAGLRKECNFIVGKIKTSQAILVQMVPK